MNFWTFLDRNGGGLFIVALILLAIGTDCGKHGCHVKVGQHEAGCVR